MTVEFLPQQLPAFDCQEAAEGRIECVFVPNGPHFVTYQIDERRFANHPPVYEVLAYRGEEFLGRPYHPDADPSLWSCK